MSMSAMSEEKIYRTMTIEEIFQRFPQKGNLLAQEMANAGLHCVGCSASTWETLEGGMYGHGKTEEEINSLIDRLNTILSTDEGSPDAITITPKAAQKLRQILEQEGKAGWGLRFGEKAAGCSGFSFFLDFSEKAKTGDTLFESEGIAIHVHHKSAERLVGSVIDYVDGLHEAGFKISNPHVKSSCGCGNSHGY
ncbi:MAG: iron-sulfur cluster assembly accessory protein [Verrucomicrobiota bacterium]|nr:iron-sulfur cluster assembly accessory protein [Verrucomicrobiota bacterium]